MVKHIETLASIYTHRYIYYMSKYRLNVLKKKRKSGVATANLS